MQNQAEVPQISNLKEKPYELVEKYPTQQYDFCQIIVAINQSQTILLAGCKDKIIVFDFLEGKLTQKQELQVKDWVYSFYFMTKSNQFISGGDGEIRIWSFDETTQQYYTSQQINTPKNFVNKVIMTKNEDQFISCGTDNAIKIWTRKNEWECLQTLNSHTFWVNDICLNESCTQLVSCGEDGSIIIHQQSENQEWKMIQQIKVSFVGHRICYIGDNLIAFQPSGKPNLEIYQLNEQNKQFIKSIDVPVNNTGNCKNLFPMLYNKDQQLLLNKNCYCVNLIRKQKNDFIQEQSITFDTPFLYGTMTQDFKYLITWDYTNKEFQVRKQK